MDDRVHRHSVRVYYEDTDAGGIVYHTAYLRFAERGRTECLRVCGFDHGTLREEAGGGFVVREMAIDFRAAASLDDELVVSTNVRDVSGTSVRMEQNVMRGDDTLVRLDVKLAFLSPSGRPGRIPPGVRQAFLNRE
ncbi:MAG: tol-pal system-associated acyl-CoA thioesterase [Rhodospirillales bacterium]|nr:tol-pal system-associated acyl-CoA thioesterase [Rhodospirillales bacterium]